MHLVGRNDHAAGGDFVADLFGREVRLAFGDAGHLLRDDAQSRLLQLGDRHERFRKPHPAVRSISLFEDEIAVIARIDVESGHDGTLREDFGLPTFW